MKMEKRVAIQGFSGCFHEEAARKFYRDRENTLIRIVECATFSDLFESFERYLQALSAVRPLIDDLRILGEYTAAL
ncbi:MAG: hypothetical protein II097_03900 [Bacteroidales bacterium]|nr:hypothetical protein [Bacteroidales bacterium]